MPTRQPTKGGADGFTLAEVLIVAGLSALVILATMGLMVTGNTNLQRAAERSTMALGASNAMTQILADLRRSGFVTLAGDRYPVTAEVVAGSPSRNHRVITLALPADSNGDGRADLIGTDVEWSIQPVAYVLESGADGLRLVRTGGGRPSQALCERVEQVVFDTPETSGFAVPLGCVRVLLVLRSAGSDGSVRQHRCETTVRLRNGERAAS